MKVISINGQEIKPGENVEVELPLARLYTDTRISMPVQVLRGKRDGPTMFISAAIHGDELNGIEIIRRLIHHKKLNIIRGTLILVPIVNVHGVLNLSRYMPDRRDLNRSFPGSVKGSLAGRVAHTFLTEIVSLCDYGIDLHTGAIHRSNLPQIRANLSDEETKTLAEVFGVPVLLDSVLRDGSLRESATDAGARVLLYEAGQALRFDEFSIRAGLKGILNILSHLGMIRKTSKAKGATIAPFVANNSAWVRANSSGIVRDLKNLGDRVKKGEALAEIGSPFGKIIDTIIAPRDGIIIGKQNIPLVQEGEGMYHIAFFEENKEVAEHLEMLQDNLLPEDATHLSQI